MASASVQRAMNVTVDLTQCPQEKNVPEATFYVSAQLQNKPGFHIIQTYPSFLKGCKHGETTVKTLQLFPERMPLEFQSKPEWEQTTRLPMRADLVIIQKQQLATIVSDDEDDSDDDTVVGSDDDTPAITMASDHQDVQPEQIRQDFSYIAAANQGDPSCLTVFFNISTNCFEIQ